MRALVLLLRVSAVLIGAAHAGISIRDHMMNEDGIQYLDLGDRYARGEWSPVNSVWSPLYPFILGVSIRFIQPGPKWEFAVAHLVTLGIYIGALACFEFFWTTVRQAVEREGQDTEIGSLALPEWAWWVSGYALFLWSSVVLIRFRAVSPDMLVSALVYLGAGFIIRIGTSNPDVRNHAFLGVSLGLGYLTKAVMFPLSGVFLAAAACGDRAPGRLPRALVGTLTFGAIALPLVVVLSAQKGRLTFGEAGRFTYLKYVNEMPYPHRVREIPAALGAPIHPTRQLNEDPDVYEFATPIPGTYPVGFDPSYWIEGVSAKLDLRRQAQIIKTNATYYADLFFHQLGGMLAVTVLLLWVGPGVFRQRLALRWRLALIAVASAGLGLYALVYVEGRYVAPFVVVLLAGLLSLIRVADTRRARRCVAAAGLLIPLFLFIELAAFDARYVPRRLTPGSIVWDTRASFDRPDAPWRIAEAMHGLGVQQGDTVGFIGYSFGATFARLARVRIVAEMPREEAERLWKLDPASRDRVLDCFAQAGAAAVITEVPPPGQERLRWTELGQSGRYLIRLGTPRTSQAQSEGPARGIGSR